MKPPAARETSAEGEASVASTASACARRLPRAPGVASCEGDGHSLVTFPSSALTAAASPSEAKGRSPASPDAPACWTRWLDALLPPTRIPASAAASKASVSSGLEPSSLMPWLHGTKHGKRAASAGASSPSRSAGRSQKALPFEMTTSSDAPDAALSRRTYSTIAVP